MADRTPESTRAVAHRGGSVTRRTLAIVGAVIAVLVLSVVMAVLVLTNTTWGHERIRRLALRGLRGPVHGVVRIGRIDGDLLHGVEASDISITDSAGAPFVSIRHAALQYAIGDLLRKRLYFHDVLLDHPVIVLVQSADGGWNYKRLFRSTGGPSDTAARGFGSWIAASNVRVVDGDLTVRSPWHPDSTLRGAARDSAIRAALSPESRAPVSAGPAGLEKTVAVHALTSRIAALRLADPGQPTQYARVASLAADIAAFRPPDAIVRDLAGTIFFTSDSLWWSRATVALSGSRIVGDGVYGLATGDLRLALRADTAALADLRFLEPRLPASGGFSGAIGVRWQGKSQDYVARQLALRTEGAQVTGALGLTMGDSLAFHDTDLRFSGIDTRLIGQLAPRLTIPREGVASGHAELAGGLHALTLDVDLTFDDRSAGRSRVVAVGQLGTGHNAFHARALTVTLAPLQVALARPAGRAWPIGGTITGRATVDGSTTSTVSASADLVHRQGSALTHLVANGDVAFAPTPAPPSGSDRPSPVTVPLAPARGGGDTANPRGPSPFLPSRVDVTARLEPLDLSAVGKFMPAAKLHGRGTGDVRVSGDMHDLVLHARFGVPGSADSSVLVVDGHFDLAAPTPGYDVQASANVFDVRAVSAAAPHTTITATASARGRGTKPESMVAAFAADVRASVFDSTAIDTVHLRGSVGDGQLRVDAAHLHALTTTADLQGAFGLVPGHGGTLSYRIAVDSLQAYTRFLPLDTTTVKPRPEQVAAAVERARADSAERAQATEVERAISGTPPLALVVDTPAALRRDRLVGRAVTSGTVQGDVRHFDLRGNLVADSVIAMGNAVLRAHAQYEWMDGPSRTSPVKLAATLDTASVGGFKFDALEARVAYHAPDGTVRVAVRQDPARQYTLNALFHYTPTEKEIRYDTLAFRFDGTVWRANRPGAVAWGSGGLTIRNVELTDGRTGLISADGFLPTHPGREADLRATVRELQLGDVASIAQTDLPVRGRLTLHAAITGSSDAPRLRGDVSLSSAFIKLVPLPNVYVEYRYDSTTLQAHAELAPKGAPSTAFATADATVPVNLASNATGSRLLDRPMHADIRLDSLPLDIVPQITTAMRDVGGRVSGRVVVDGTPRRPVPRGNLALDHGRATIVASGTALREMVARLHLTRDSLVLDSLLARTPATNGRLRVAGSYDLTDPTVPIVNVAVTANNARVLNTRERGRVDVDANLTLAGPTAAPFFSGNTVVRSAVLYLPQSSHNKVIDISDPTVYLVADTTDESVRDIIPKTPELLTHLRMDVDISVSRDSWVRNKDANVEAHTSGPLTVRVDRARQAVVVDGTVTTDRGEYAFMGKRFVISKGTATFIGTPKINPTIAATGEYDVPVPGRQALAIQITIGGSLDSLRLSLSSNAEPPIPQSDLLSYLAFSRPTNSLTQQSQAGSLVGTSNAGGVVGTASAFVQEQLAAQALGVLTDQAKGDLARSLGADVLDLTTGNAYTDIAQNRSGAAFLQNTQIEFGKYFTPRTYVAVQGSVAPGARVVHSLSRGLSVEVSGEPLYLLGQPTLSTTTNTPLTGIFGLTLLRRWRF